MSEQWKDVVGYEGLYMVSNKGRARSYDRPVFYKNGTCRIRRGKILSMSYGTNGYLQMHLHSDDGHWHTHIHRLVADAFICPRPTPQHQVNHKNGDKTDNTPENLEWVTASENAYHRVRVLGQMRLERNPLSKLTEAAVRDIRQQAKTPYHGLWADLGRKYGVAKETVMAAASGKTWAALPMEDVN